jgi:hypothetical protein
VRSRPALRWILLVLGGLLLVAVTFGAPGGDADELLDPDGTGPSGARGLVLVLRELGADVEVVRGAPPPAAATAVVLQDRLGDDDRQATRRWVQGGGVLLVADPSSPLVDAVVDGPCPAALAGVEEVEVDVAAPSVRRSDGREGTCFGGLIATAELGAGTVVAVATPAPFTNELLDEADDAVLAAAVLAPAPGTLVAVLDGPSVAAAADEDLVDLLGPSVRQSLVQVAAAVGLWVLWRGRRLGRPVVEDQPVAVAGSELVVAVGRLLDARRRPDEAAAALRADVRRVVDARLGLPPGADVRTAAAAVAARTGLDEARAAGALGLRPVGTDDELLAVTADLDRIRSDLVGRPRDRHPV